MNNMFNFPRTTSEILAGWQLPTWVWVLPKKYDPRKNMRLRVIRRIRFNKVKIGD